MNDECNKVCKALLELIKKVCTDCNTVPDGFNLSFGDDRLKITADINLEYDVAMKIESDEIIEEFIRNSESSEFVEEFINRIWKNDKKE